MSKLNVKYIKTSDIRADGREVNVIYSLHIFNDWNEAVFEHKGSFEELKETINVDNLKDYLKSLVNQYFYKTVLENDGVYFNHTWYSVMDLERYSILKNVLRGANYVAYR